MTASAPTVHTKNDRLWASPSSKPRLTSEGQQMRGPDDKTLWTPIVSFETKALGDKFSTQVVEALRGAVPNALPGPGHRGAGAVSAYIPPGSQPSPEPDRDRPTGRATEVDAAPPPPPDLDDEDEANVVVTFFADYAATAKREERYSLEALAELVRTAAADTKERLPWLKLARFGDIRSGKNSLRHNDNVVAVTGIEADYDAEQVNFEAAGGKLAGAGLLAILYTSPSHTEDAPRWRVLCPCSREYPPDARDRVMARLNGLFGGIFSRESWVLSQSYYYGRVGNPDHHAVVFSGVPIDLADQLDAGAIGLSPERNIGQQAHPKSRPEDITEARVRGLVEALLENIRNATEGEKHFTLRNNCRTIGGYLHLTDWSVDEAVEQALAALPAADDWDKARETALWAIKRGMEKPLELEERPRERGNGIDHDAAGQPEAGTKPPPDWEDAHPPSDEDGSGTSGQIWPEPVDCFTTYDASPATASGHDVPTALWPFIEDTAERMGVATSSVALATFVACSAVCSDNWRLQPKRGDYTWTESARLWGAIVGDPASMKTPIINAAIQPISRMEAKAHEEHRDALRRYRQDYTAWKKAKDDTLPEPQRPRGTRWMVEDATIQALQEVLRDDEEAKWTAPAGKVLVHEDELGEFLANFDRFSQGRSGGDRGAYLRLYNGGPFSVDRIGRGSFYSPNWSGCIIGGIQPEPIQRVARDAVDDGLLQRFSYDVPPPKTHAGSERAPNGPAVEQYCKLFPALAALQPSAGQDSVVLHRDAYEARDAINTLAQSVAAMPDSGTRLKSALGKWPGLFARLALTYHLTEIAAARSRGELGPTLNVLQPQTAQRAANYMRHVLLPHLLRADTLMFATVQTGHAKWIAGHILAHHLDRITVRDIVRAYRALSAPEDRTTLDSTMANLVAIGWLSPEPSRNPLVPLSAWLVNPAVHALFAQRAAHEHSQRVQIVEAIRTAARH